MLFVRSLAARLESLDHDLTEKMKSLPPAEAEQYASRSPSRLRYEDDSRAPSKAHYNRSPSPGKLNKSASMNDISGESS